MNGWEHKCRMFDMSKSRSQRYLIDFAAVFFVDRVDIHFIGSNVNFTVLYPSKEFLWISWTTTKMRWGTKWRIHSIWFDQNEGIQYCGFVCRLRCLRWSYHHWTTERWSITFIYLFILAIKRPSKANTGDQPLPDSKPRLVIN